ncbi:NAD-dependent epimerase/dehydratase family protein [Nocardioides sp. YIM 152315]|uniref:NAD-dependent epimerase/dehydratase family protein n=1 Tax=Nocardioides sp. YIM 152315 TaxID=3031760 RepID=UPI0023DBDFAA|nr:NAD-dependent epimerase/dehydratase family protein [Nocardioides sp. YIM 152315]MDF1604268.1 epimerase [Nocardioides sp. YIM 152315]
MKILVLGGSVFLSRAVAVDAAARGHDVTCANRGTSGSVPGGAALVRWDRTEDVPAELAETAYDAVVDVARMPSWVRAGVATWPGAHWVFVSTVNVYADDSIPGGRPGTLPLRDPRPDDVDLASDPEAYGPMKVACEEAVRAGAASWTVIRPGLIVGPGDPTGRFTYWPVRLADGGEALAGGTPDDRMQVIDVRDLAAWIVTCAEQRTSGDYDGVGEVLPIGDLIARVRVGVGSDTTVTWVPQEFLSTQGVEPWMGPEALPLWLPRPEYDGLGSHDPAPSYAAGLVLRPLADTARDTLAWVRATSDAPVTGITREREAALLAAWHARG